ncbi:unnamed protein product, partial [Iphiclides podalirius]
MHSTSRTKDGIQSGRGAVTRSHSSRRRPADLGGLLRHAHESRLDRCEIRAASADARTGRRAAQLRRRPRSGQRANVNDLVLCLGVLFASQCAAAAAPPASVATRNAHTCGLMISAARFLSDPYRDGGAKTIASAGPPGAGWCGRRGGADRIPDPKVKTSTRIIIRTARPGQVRETNAVDLPSIPMPRTRPADGIGLNVRVVPRLWS